MLQTLSSLEREPGAKKEPSMLTEEELRAQLLSERNEFFDLALHDIQSPVRRLSTLLERLFSQHEIQQLPNAAPFIERIKQVTSELHSLTKGLASLYETDHEDKGLTCCDLNEVVWTAIDELKHAVDIKPSQFHISKLPSVTGNAEQLKLLFMNLFHNAIKFQRSGIEPLIYVTVNEFSPAENVSEKNAHPAYYTLTITDNGMGIKPEQVEKIFEPFVRLNGKSAFPGSGLGLAVCRKIVEKHHGEIHASPGIEEGCLIKITFPKITSL